MLGAIRGRRGAAFFLAVLLVLGGCGGGGGGGGGSGSGVPVLLLITASGVSGPLWQNVQGTPTVPITCPSPVPVNAHLTFTFGGAVDPSSLPAGIEAVGSIAITTTPGVATSPARGWFEVSDDPSLPPGNQRRVTFVPVPLSDPGNLSGAGLQASTRYYVEVPSAGSGAPVVQVAGQPLATQASTCFLTCNPALPGASCFTDPTPGAPFVTSTTPGSGEPSPPAISPVVAGNRVSLFFNEPLFPSGISLDSVRILTPTSAQVPGSVVFYQAGTAEAGHQGSRIDYVASSQLLAGTVFEIILSNQVQDFGGNPAALYDPSDPTAPSSGRRFFQTTTLPTCPQPPIVETFDTTQSRAALSGPIAWNGTGQVTATFIEDVLGNGAFGPLTFGSGPGTLDPGMATIVNGGQVAFEHGAWNTTSITIAAGANVRCTGHAAGNLWRIHLRSLGTVSISGMLNANAGTSLTAAIGSTEQGPRPGYFNNGTPGNPTWVAGGVGGSGGGRGGDASQTDKTGPPLRTVVGENGHGPPIDGQDNMGPFGTNPHFGGGTGGQSAAFYPQSGLPGEVGGLGGAGGSAFASGAHGGPNAAAPACTPVVPSVQTRALATGQPAAFATPISLQSAGSGGGGGGDRLEAPGVGSDDQGGGGGGGGGGIRISCLGDLTINPAAVVSGNGASGAAGNVFLGGNGGGGSGGEIWLQSFAQVVIASSATMTVDPGSVASACGNQAAGPGGRGLYQFEDADGVVNTAFAGVPSGGANVTAIQIPYVPAVVGTATSAFFDAGYGSPDYTGVQEIYDLGTVPGGAVSVAYQGAFETVSGGGPDLATLTAPVSGSNIDALDGHRFIRFTITLSFAPPPAATPSHVLPSVDQISIDFRAPLNCP